MGPLNFTFEYVQNHLHFWTSDGETKGVTEIIEIPEEAKQYELKQDKLKQYESKQDEPKSRVKNSNFSLLSTQIKEGSV